jgi:hypothetical protein
MNKPRPPKCRVLFCDNPGEPVIVNGHEQHRCADHPPPTPPDRYEAGREIQDEGDRREEAVNQERERRDW